MDTIKDVTEHNRKMDAENRALHRYIREELGRARKEAEG